MKRIITLAFLLIGLFSQELVFGEKKEITIGGIAALTGDGAHYGVNAQRGAILALEKLERDYKAGKYKIRFTTVWEDESGGKAERAVAAYKKLTTIDKVDLIFGPTYLDGLFAVAPIAKRDEIFMVTATNPSLSTPNVFSTWIDPRQEADIIARRIYSSYKSVSVLSCQQAWDSLVGKNFKKSLEDLGGKVVSFEEPLPDTTQVKMEVLRLKQKKPEAVFISSYTLFSKYTKELKRLGVDIPIFSIEVDQGVIDAASGAAEGVVFIAPNIPDDNKFAAEYKKRFGANPDVPVYQAYDAILLLAKAIQDKGSSTSDLNRFFSSFGKYKGVSGDLWTKDGQVQYSTAFFKVKNNSYEKLDD